MQHVAERCDQEGVHPEWRWPSGGHIGYICYFCQQFCARSVREVAYSEPVVPDIAASILMHCCSVVEGGDGVVHCASLQHHWPPFCVHTLYETDTVPLVCGDTLPEGLRQDIIHPSSLHAMHDVEALRSMEAHSTLHLELPRGRGSTYEQQDDCPTLTGVVAPTAFLVSEAGSSHQVSCPLPNRLVGQL